MGAGRGVSAVIFGAWLLLVAPGATAMAPSPPAWLARAEAMLDHDTDGALALADRMVDATEQQAPAAERYAAYLARAGLRRRLGRYGEALLDFERCRALAAEIGDDPGVAHADASLGVVFALAGLYAEALEALQRALAGFLRAGDHARASGVLTNLGNVHGDTGDHVAAREHYQRALAMKREHGIERGVAVLLNNLGDLEREHGDQARARALFEDAAQRHQAQGESADESLSRGNLAVVLARLGDYRAAFAELDRAEQLAGPGEARPLAAVHTARAEAWLRMARDGDAADAAALRAQRLQRAAAAIERARGIADGIDGPRRRARIAALASEIHAEAGALGEALVLLQEAGHHAAEQQRRADAARQAVITARFEDARQRAEIAALRERQAQQQGELDRQRALALLLGGAVAMLTLVALLMSRQAGERRRHAQALAARNAELGGALREAERLREHSERIAASHRRLLVLAGGELRGPLMTIRNLADRLLAEAGAGPAEQRQLAAIAQATGELVRVADQISASSQPVDPDIAGGCDAGAVLHAVVDELDARFVGRDRRLQVAGEGMPVAIDRRRLQRVLLDLLDEVLQRNPGHAAVGVAMREAGGGLAIEIDDPAGAVVQALADPDRGIGVALACDLLRQARGELGVAATGPVPRLRLWLPALQATAA
jgi:tetratricopeptide (TPR) repeat protein